MTFTKQKLSEYLGASTKTLDRRIKDLEEKGEFKKQSAGSLFDEKEALTLANILNFTIPGLHEIKISK